MAVSLYFGLPGSGKTTIMVSKAIQAVRSGRYRNVYCNVRISVFGVTYIDNDCIGKYDLHDCLILIDEATLFADNRAHKEFGKDKIEYFLLHRHYNADVMLFTQQWDGVDKKIRVITDRVYYVYKGFWTRHWFTKCYRIPYGIIIPDPRNKSSGEKLGDIVQGYCKPNILVRMFATWIYRPALYQYFDSWQRTPLPALPQKYTPYYEVKDGKVIQTFDQSRVYKRFILLRSGCGMCTKLIISVFRCSLSPAGWMMPQKVFVSIVMLLMIVFDYFFGKYADFTLNLQIYILYFTS